jgi:Domain of unknown function (DUF4124)
MSTMTAMSRTTLFLLAALLGSLLALPAHAQWKWRDKSGLIQYSDLAPPPGVAEADILQRPNVATVRAAPAALPASGPVSGPQIAIKTTDPELEAKRKKAEQDKADQTRAEDERRAQAKLDNCSRAKAYMRSLDDGLRIARTNEKGEREVLDDKARAEEARRTREIMASDCK